MLLVFSLILGAVVTALVITISSRFEEPMVQMGVKAGVAALLSIILFATASKVPIIVAMLFLIVALAMMGYMIWWWIEDGSTVRELALFTLVDFLLMLIAKALATRILDTTIPWWAAGIITALPSVVFTMSVGLFIANMIWFREITLKGGELDDTAES